MPSFFLQLLFIIAIVVIVAVLMTGVRVLIHHFFDIIVEKKMYFIYFLFYAILLIGIIGLTVYNGYFSGASKIITIIILVGYILITEYIFIFRKYFDFESGGKYLLCQTVSYFANFLLVVLITNILITILALLFG